MLSGAKETPHEGITPKFTERHMETRVESRVCDQMRPKSDISFMNADSMFGVKLNVSS